MAVGSIRREGHGANGTRAGGPYTTMAHTTTSTTTTYGGGHQLTAPIPPTPILVYPYTHPLVSPLWMSTRNGWYGDQWVRAGLAMVSIGATLLLANTGTVSCLALATAGTRSGYLLSHLYIGAGLTTPLRLVLAMIETLSTAFRTVSLSLRVLCNAVAGHTLLLVLQALIT